MPLFSWFCNFLDSRAEIVKFFRWYFGRNDDTKRTFWNQLAFSYQWLFEGEGYDSIPVKVLLGQGGRGCICPPPASSKGPEQCCRLEWRRICLHNNNNQQGFFSQLLTYRGTMGWNNSYFYTPRFSRNISEILQRIWLILTLIVFG